MKELREIYCDLNAQITKRCYSLERFGSVRDLESINLNLEKALGKEFRFFMDDADEDGTPNDIMFDGIVVFSEEYGFMAERKSEVYWRSDLQKNKDI